MNFWESNARNIVPAALAALATTAAHFPADRHADPTWRELGSSPGPSRSPLSSESLSVQGITALAIPMIALIALIPAIPGGLCPRPERTAGDLLRPGDAGHRPHAGGPRQPRWCRPTNGVLLGALVDRHRWSGASSRSTR